MKTQLFVIGFSLMLAPGVFADTNKVSTPRPAIEKSSSPHGLATRQCLVQNPENLKRVKGLDASKPLEELIFDYLQQNGVKLAHPVGVQKAPEYIHSNDPAEARVVSIEKRGLRLQVRATASDLEKAQELLAKLRDMK